MRITNTLPPMVIPNDDGIRPAGDPDRCFYCNAKIGTLHAKTCVCVEARVAYKVKASLPGRPIVHGVWETYDPWSWFQNGNSGDQTLDELAGHWYFARNKGTWCADNADDIVWTDPNVEELLNKYSEEHGCCCNVLEFYDYEVLDGRFHIRDRS